METSRITVGHDLEVFISRKGAIICPYEIIRLPKRVIPCGEYGGMNRDGMALELNPSPGSVAVVVENTKKLFEDAVYEASQIGAELCKSIKVVVEDFEKVAPDVRRIGCDPDYNAYTGKQTPTDETRLEMKERYAGGHIHFGFPYAIVPENVVKLFDCTGGLMSVLWSTPESKERREQYGQAGSYRWNPEKYILEYRVPDANWGFVEGGFDKLCKAMMHGLSVMNSSTQNPFALLGLQQKDVVNAINTCDIDSATKMLKKIKLI